MTHPCLNGRTFALLMGAWLIAVPVRGQSSVPREVPLKPYRALFGGEGSQIPSLHALDLTISLDAGMDDGMYAHGIQAADTSAPASSGSEQIYTATAELAYARRGRRFGSDLHGLASLPRYSLFPDQPSKLAYGGNGAVDLLTARTSVRASANFMHSPYYASALDPTTGPGIGNGYLGRMSALSPNNQGNAGASLRYRLGRRTSASVAYAYDGSFFTEEVRWSRTQGVNASLERQLSRSTEITGGYWYRTADYRSGETLTAGNSHDVSAGMSRTWRRRQGRTSTLKATVGYSSVDEFGRRYDGWPWSAHVDHAVGAQWSLAADYSRSLQYSSTVQQSVWADRLTVLAAGYVNARVKLTFDGNYWNGQRVANVGGAFNMYWTSAGVHLALAPWAAITAGYSYYRYDYPPGFSLPAGMPSQMNRQRVQIGARFWVPLARAGHSGEARAPVNQ